MSVMEKLTPLRRRFFEELGIFKDEDIPKSFWGVIRSYDEEVGAAEKFVHSDYTVCQNCLQRVPIKDVVGTNHSRYAGKTWIDAFMDLARGEENLEQYFANPGYYDQLLKADNDIYIGGLAEKMANIIFLMELAVVIIGLLL